MEGTERKTVKLTRRWLMGEAKKLREEMIGVGADAKVIVLNPGWKGTVQRPVLAALEVRYDDGVAMDEPMVLTGDE